MRFIDLFAGLGGFHLALSRLGHECVFASEIQPKLQKLYKINFPDVPIYGDITKIREEDIPPHEILCGGFPCQPFSFSGKKQGFDDELGRGNLFDEICRILRYHHPKYIFLENVSALPGHDGGRTWKVIRQKLDALGYDIRSHIYSPHEFGIPQHRPRFYIVGMLRDEQGISGMHRFHFQRPQKDMTSDVRTIVDMTDNDRVLPVRRDLHPVFDAWQEFVDNVTKRDGYMPSHCIFTMEFGADYEFEDTPPAFQPLERLRGRRGNYGQVLEGETRAELIAGLPFYMRKTQYKDTYPEFKKILIRQNREFYQRHKDWIDPWLQKIRQFPRTQRMLEWSTNQDWDFRHHVIQLRPSGIRIRSMNYVPTITLCTTATPILPFVPYPPQGALDKKGHPYTPDDFRWGRYISHNEAARIQSMQELNYGNLSRVQKFKALGNAVNVDVVELIAQRLLPRARRS